MGHGKTLNVNRGGTSVPALPVLIVGCWQGLRVRSPEVAAHTPGYTG